VCYGGVNKLMKSY